jgi:hypothetical protein
VCVGHYKIQISNIFVCVVSQGSVRKGGLSELERFVVLKADQSPVEFGLVLAELLLLGRLLVVDLALLGEESIESVFELVALVRVVFF